MSGIVSVHQKYSDTHTSHLVLCQLACAVAGPCVQNLVNPRNCRISSMDVGGGPSQFLTNQLLHPHGRYVPGTAPCAERNNTLMI